ncbi:hypothetical protein CMI45_00895 [Candidatus Pacearchaeota archaeon]|nr:hypothetical protein [Candidatus Pacearchaeota archaeon]
MAKSRTKEYDGRFQWAKFIAEDYLKDFCMGVLLIGSVSYMRDNPEGLSSEDDIDLVGITNFSRLREENGKRSFKKLYDNLRQEDNDRILPFAIGDKIDTFSLLWHIQKYDVGLYFWDEAAFNNIISIPNNGVREERYENKQNRQFFGFDYGEDFTNQSSVNPYGTKLEFYGGEEIENGRVHEIYPYFEDKNEIYLGPQAMTMLMRPTVLYQNRFDFAGVIYDFNMGLRARLVEKYDEYGTSKCCLLNVLPKPLRNKIPGDLKSELGGKNVSLGKVVRCVS